MANKKSKKVVKKTVKKQTATKPAKKKTGSAKAKPVKTKKAKVAKKTVKQTAKKTVQAKSPVVKPIAKAAKAKASATPNKAKANIDYSKAITPLHDRLVVRVFNAERITAGGLIIPDTALMATGYLKAEVLAVGTGTTSKKGNFKPLDVKIGDKVLFAEYAGTEVKFNSENLHIIHETDVMGILQE